MPKQAEPCWVCTHRKKKYMQNHHVVSKANDMDLTVPVCRGCHWLVGLLARMGILADETAIGRLLTLARFQAGLPDARTVIKYEYTKE